MKSNRKPFGRSMITPPESCEVRSRLFGPMYLPGSRKSSALLTKSPSVACALNRESEYEIGVFNLEMKRTGLRTSDRKTLNEVLRGRNCDAGMQKGFEVLRSPEFFALRLTRTRCWRAQRAGLRPI